MNCDCDNEMNGSFVVAVHWTRAPIVGFAFHRFFVSPTNSRSNFEQMFFLSLFRSSASVLRVRFAHAMHDASISSMHSIWVNWKGNRVCAVSCTSLAATLDEFSGSNEFMCAFSSNRRNGRMFAFNQHSEIIILLNFVASLTIWNLSEMQSIKGKFNLTYSVNWYALCG